MGTHVTVPSTAQQSDQGKMKIQNWNCEKGMQIRKYEQAAGGQHVGRTKRWKQDSFYHKSEIL